MAKLICPIHGYYDAREGDCPMCRGQFDPSNSPVPLGDSTPTAMGREGDGFSGGFSNGETELGNNKRRNDFTDQTELGNAQRYDVTEFEITDNSPIALLCVKEGPRRGQIHKIKDNTILGRSKGDIIIDDPKASSCHAKFTYEEEKFYIWDFGSRNGTYVNDERIRSATELKENDVIKIGDFVFLIKII